MTPGPRTTPTLASFASSPMARPSSYKSFRFQVCAAVTAVGKHVASSEPSAPSASGFPFCLRRPFGPSVIIISGTSQPATSLVCQKSLPLQKAIFSSFVIFAAISSTFLLSSSSVIACSYAFRAKNAIRPVPRTAFPLLSCKNYFTPQDSAKAPPHIRGWPGP